MPSIATLIAQLERDPRRDQLGWDPAFSSVQDALLSTSDDQKRREILEAWLAKHQPCLFGKIAAKTGRLHFCFLTPTDLVMEDLAIREKIQASHREWVRKGSLGESHGFIVLAIHERLANARPNAVLLSLAIRLAELYLLREIVADKVYLDQLFLKVHGQKEEHALRWHVGVNVFAAAGDRRWWQDHRIPGGLAFSANSVGHMAKSAEVVGKMNQLLSSLGVEDAGGEIGKVENLEDALRLAMRTIANASDAVSGQATRLVSIDEADLDSPHCPVQLGKALEDFNPNWYVGYYHTDYTVPSLYFRDDVTRPTDAQGIRLDFTYLFHNDVENPDHLTMGTGEQIMGEDGVAAGASGVSKSRRQWPQRCPLSEIPD